MGYNYPGVNANSSIRELYAAAALTCIWKDINFERNTKYRYTNEVALLSYFMGSICRMVQERGEKEGLRVSFLPVSGFNSLTGLRSVHKTANKPHGTKIEDDR
jgi:hypothetical protein